MLSTEERTCPNGLSTKEKEVWFNERVELQREGIEHGVKPQNLFDLPSKLKKLWLSRVWNPYLLTLSMEERRIIKSTAGPDNRTE